MTSITDDADHVVSNDSMEAGLTAGEGVYRADCGSIVVPPSLCEPPSHRCSCCRAVLRARGKRVLEIQARQCDSRSWLVRFLRRCG
ncbi:hypothetical protein [Kibdelosporangium philippinense]|uniref:hypothetical protein n=1 Tax=Kibdelosporangium philippinense TaxID=211113 RepID=UPI0036236155